MVRRLCSLFQAPRKSFSKKKMQKKRGGCATIPFPKSRASYFHFARFNTFPLYYLRAWHRLKALPLQSAFPSLSPYRHCPHTLIENRKFYALKFLMTNYFCYYCYYVYTLFFEVNVFNILY